MAFEPESEVCVEEVVFSKEESEVCTEESKVCVEGAVSEKADACVAECGELQPVSKRVGISRTKQKDRDRY
jgi:hypothetical protein